MRQDARAAAAAAARQRAKTDREIANLMELLKKGVASTAILDELAALEKTKSALARADTAISDVSPLFHPTATSRLWAEQIRELRDALIEDDADGEARQAVRELIEEIRLTPRDGVLSIEVNGNLAAMLGAAQNAKRSPEGDLSLQLALVAGAGFEPATFGL